MLAIVVVNQSIMGRPPLQDNELSTRPSQFRPTLRQCQFLLRRSSSSAIRRSKVSANAETAAWASADRVSQRDRGSGG